MTKMVLATQHSLRIASLPENLVQVERLIDDVCKEFSVTEECYGNILVALTEAVNNAIHHGNKAQPEKLVVVELETSEQALAFMVEDQGPGFDFNDLPDPTDPSNIEKENGRGIFLMRNLADEVEFRDNGKRVVLKFKRS